jgi:hypothetical protein
MNNFIHTLLAAACLLAALGDAAAAPGIVIRAGACSADAFVKGSGVLADSDGNIQGLSVNCTTATGDKSKYANYLNGIAGYTSYCVGTTAAVASAGGKLKTDKVTGNPYHCLLAGNAGKLAGALTKR